MKVIFYLSKEGHYRVYAPWISEALKLKYSVELWHNKEIPNTSIPFIDSLIDHYKDNLAVRRFNNDEDIIQNSYLLDATDFFFNLYPENFLSNSIIKKKLNGKVVNIQSGVDTVLTLHYWNKIHKDKFLHLHDYKKIILIWTKTFFNKQIEITKKFSSSNDKSNISYLLNSNIKKYSFGFREIDRNTLNLSNKEIKKSMKIPEEKKVLIYLPYPYAFSRSHKSWFIAFSGLYSGFTDEGKKNNFFNKIIIPYSKTFFASLFIFLNIKSFYWFLLQINEKQIIKSIRTFCNENNLLFIIKKRKKHRIAKIGYKLADKIIDDHEGLYYPTNYQKLLKISSLVIGYHSTSVFEAVRMRKPYINIECPKEHFRGEEILQRIHSAKQNYIYNFRGVVWNYDIRYMINKFKSMKLDMFQLDAKQIKKYEENFLDEKRYSDEEGLFEKLIKMKKE